MKIGPTVEMYTDRRTFAAATGSLCSYSKYFSTFTKVLKKAGVILQDLRSRRVIWAGVGEVRERERERERGERERGERERKGTKFMYIHVCSQGNLQQIDDGFVQIDRI